jgi:uncharacterized membrane protein
MRNVAQTLLIMGGLITAALLCHAKPEYQQDVAKQYTLKAGGAVEKANKACTLCHQGAPPKLNPYGTEMDAALKNIVPRKLTPAILQTIEAKDSDGDGFTNEAELLADTLPGDASSKPVGAPVSANAAAANTPKPDPKDAPATAPNPYAFMGFIAPKHAQHPIVVHFPVALFFVSLLFDVIGILRRNSALFTAGYLNLSIAALSAPVAVVTGILAWRIHFAGMALAGPLLQHLVLGVVTTILITAMWGVRRNLRKNAGAEGRELNTAYFLMAGIGLITMILTGHLGGYLVYGE